jgi:transcriptional regulator GlxA family with amidase domain
MHEVTVLARYGVVTFDLAIASRVFSLATTDGGAEARYRVTVGGPTPGRVMTAEGFEVNVASARHIAARADTIVVPGAVSDGTLSDPLRDVLWQASKRGARIVSFCTGAFALAAAGLLDGRRATTHWLRAQELARNYPMVDVDPRALYVEDDGIFTSGGAAAGIDLALHMIRIDHGAQVADKVARRMVVARQRAEGQAQFNDRWVPEQFGSHLDGTREWIRNNLHRPLTLNEMAGRAFMSPRSFSRHFVEETGLSPIRWVVHQRVQAARAVLASSGVSIEEVAMACGFGSSSSFRQHFRRVTGTTPMAYRTQVRGVDVGEPQGSESVHPRSRPPLRHAA